MESDIKVVYVQVDPSLEHYPEERHFIYSEDSNMLTNIVTTFSKECLLFDDFPGLSTYKTCEREDLVNLCKLTFDKIVFLDNEFTQCRHFVNSVFGYEDEN